MKEKSEYFFLTVANYSLPENERIYLERIGNILEAPDYGEYAYFLFHGLAYKLGLVKLETLCHDPQGWGSVFNSFYKDELPSFTEEELRDFEQQRTELVEVLDQIISGKPLEKIAMWEVIKKANLLKPARRFDLRKTITEVEKYPLAPEADFSYLQDLFGTKRKYTGGRCRELDGLLHLACYTLLLLLMNDEGKGRIKKCPYCGKFFLAKSRNRQICYSIECFREYKRLQKRRQREVDPVKYI